MVEVSRIGDKLVGRAPEQTRYFMEVRGIGIVMCAICTGGAVLPEKTIDWWWILNIIMKSKNTYGSGRKKPELWKYWGYRCPIR